MLGNSPDEDKVMDEIAAALREKESSCGKIYERELTPRRTLSGGSIFFLTFAVSLAVLLILMYALLSGTSRNGELFGGFGEESSALTGSGVSADHSLDSYHPTAADGKRLLVVMDGGEGSSFYWLLHISPKTGEMTVLSLSDTLFSVGHNLRESAGSFSGAAEAVRALLGEDSVDRVLRLERADTVKLVDALGGMEWEFHDRYTSDTLDIPVGKHRLDGATLVQLLSETEPVLPGPAEILAALLGQRFTEDAFNKDDGLFETLVSCSEGNISVMDYYDGKKFLRWFLHLSAGYRTVTVGLAEDGILSEGERALAREKLGLEP